MGGASLALRTARADGEARMRIMAWYAVPLLGGMVLGYIGGTAEGGLVFLTWVGLVGAVSTLGAVLSVPSNTRQLQGRICLELAGVLAFGGIAGGLASGLQH